MPLFDFTCRGCGRTFEHMTPRGMPPPPCPHCGSGDVQKLFTTPPPVIFKGSGFYKTDSRSTPPKSEQKSEGTSTEKKVETKGEKKAP